MNETKEPGIRIAQIFLGSALLEHSPDVMEKPATTPAGDHTIQLTVSGAITEDGTVGVATVRVETTPENKGCYRFMLEMVGMVERVGDAPPSIHEYITEYAPVMMYPFVREAVANLTGRGRFGPVWLRTMNFNTLTKQGNPGIISGGSQENAPTP